MKKIFALKLAAITQYVFFTILILLTLGVFFLIFRVFNTNYSIISICFGVLLGYIVLSFFIIVYILKKDFKKRLVIAENDFINYLNLLESLINIIIEYSKNMNTTLDATSYDNDLHKNLSMKNHEEVLTVIEQIKGKKDKIKSLIGTYNVDKINLIFKEIREFQSLVSHFSLLAADSIESYKTYITDIKNNNETIIYNIIHLLYNLQVAIPILSNISVASNDYSLTKIRGIFEKFDTVSDYSQNIYKSTQDTINSFMEKDNNNSLAYISVEAKNIMNKLDNFFKTMTDLKKVSDSFLKNGMNSLEEFEKTSMIIEDISEKIKLIAINVRIEASRLSDESGFKVLGKEIREFAEITSKISKESNARIKDTLNSIEVLKKDYLKSMNDAYDYLVKIKDSFMPFESIIESAFNKIKLVIEYMDSFSKGINDKIKETIGMLQFHDVTSQEARHIIAFIDELSNMFQSLIGSNLNIDKIIKEEDKKIFAREVVLKLKELTTTETERNIIHKYADLLKIGLDEDADTLKDIKKVDDKTILF